MIAVRPYKPIAVNTKTRFNVLEYDPTHTLTLRNAFVRDLNGRFNRLIADIRKAVIKEDVFGLKKTKPVVFATPGAKAFEFAENPQKVEEFTDWLKREMDKGILEVKEYEQLGKSIHEPWTNKYIQDSYKRGVIRARYEMKNAGFKVPSIKETGGIEVSMSTPFHAERAGLLFIRAYNELKGITDAMSQQIARVLSQGMIDGDGPSLLAKKMVAVIKDAGAGELGLTDTLGRFIPARRRAEIMARTEIVRAHHKAMVQEYKNWNIKGFVIKAEWSTAGDTRVCAVCGGYEGSVWSLKEIENMIPIHPQCRCVALPSPAKEQVKEAPVAPAKEESQVDKVAANFKNEKDAKTYLKYKKTFQTNFDKLSDEQKKVLQELRKVTATPLKRLSYEIKTDAYDVVREIAGDVSYDMRVFMDEILSWKLNTQEEAANAFKYMARQYEKDVPEMVMKKFGDRFMQAFLEDFGEEKFKEGYLQWRALSQVYLENTVPEGKLVLYRGMSGHTGNNIAESIYNAWKTKSMERTLFPIKDMSLVGYSSDYNMAKDFGTFRAFNTEGVFELVLKQEVELKDVVLPSDLFDMLFRDYDMAKEREFVLLGKQGNWSKADLHLRVADSSMSNWTLITDFE